jgi:hypothetical protein
MILKDFTMLGNYSHTNYRCDDFIKDHDGLHVLFIGDSFAAGDGLEKEDTWAYKVHQKISETQKTSGYFNVGCSGISISESVDQFFKYCYHYGSPDVVFFVTTELDRDYRYAKEGTLESFINRMYMYFEQYCRAMGIEAYSFSWLKSTGLYSEEPKRYWWKDGAGTEMIRPLWTEQTKNQERSFNTKMLNGFETFYDYDVKHMMRRVFEYDKVSNTPHKSLWAEDLSHPGTSFHDFYAEFIYEKYLGNKNGLSK